MSEQIAKVARTDIEDGYAAQQALLTRLRELSNSANNARLVKDDKWLDEIQAEGIKVNEQLAQINQETLAIEREFLTLKPALNDQILEELSGETAGGYLEKFGGTDERAAYNPMAPPQARQPSFKIAPDGPQKLKAKLGELWEIPAEKIILESPLGAEERLQLGALETAAEKQAVLRENFYTVAGVNHGGKDTFCVQRAPGATYEIVDPIGPDLGDVAEMAPEVPAMSIAGLAGGAGLVAGPAVGSAAFNATYQAIRGGQSRLAGAMQDIPKEAVKTVGQRTAEGTVGVGIDLLTLGTMKALGVGKVGKALPNQEYETLQKAAETLNKSGKWNVQAPIKAMQGQEGLRRARAVATEQPGTLYGRQTNNARTQFARFEKAILDGDVDPAARQSIMSGLAENAEKAAEKVAGSNQSIKDRLKNLFVSKNSKLAPAMQEIELYGQRARGIIEPASEAARAAQKAEFAAATADIDKAGPLATHTDIYNVVSSARNQYPTAENAKITKFLDRIKDAPQQAQALQQEISAIQSQGGRVPQSMIDELGMLEAYSQPFNAGAVRNIIQDLRQMVPDSMVGGTQNDALSSAAAKAVQDMFEQRVAARGSFPAWESFRSKYADYADFNSGTLDQILGTARNGKPIADSDVIRKALGNEAAAKEVITTVGKVAGPQKAAELQDVLQEAFLLQSKAGGDTAISFRPEVARALWGVNPDGTANPLRGERIVQTLNEVNQAYKLSKVPLTKESALDIKRLMAPIGTKERQAILKKMYVRDQAQKELEQMANNTLIQKAKQGDWDIVATDEFMRAAVDGNPQHVGQVVDQIKKKSLKDFQYFGSDFMTQWARKFSTKELGTNQVARGTEAGHHLLNGEAVIASLDGWTRGKAGAPAWVHNMDKVAGKETTDLIIAYSRLNAAYAPMKMGDQQMRGRFLASGSGVTGWIGGKTESVTDAMLGTLWGAGKLQPFLKLMMRDIGPEAEARNAKLAMALITQSRQGIESAAHVSRSDPDFTQALVEHYATLPKRMQKQREEELNMSAMRANAPTSPADNKVARKALMAIPSEEQAAKKFTRRSVSDISPIEDFSYLLGW